MAVEVRQHFVEAEVNLMKDTIWRLTGRVFALENFIKKKFGDFVEVSSFSPAVEVSNSCQSCDHSKNRDEEAKTKRPNSEEHSTNQSFHSNKRFKVTSKSQTQNQSRRKSTRKLRKNENYDSSNSSSNESSSDSNNSDSDDEINRDDGDGNESADTTDDKQLVVVLPKLEQDIPDEVEEDETLEEEQDWGRPTTGMKVELFPNSGVFLTENDISTAKFMSNGTLSLFARHLFRRLYTAKELHGHSLFGKTCNVYKGSKLALPSIDEKRRDAIINHCLQDQGYSLPSESDNLSHEEIQEKKKVYRLMKSQINRSLSDFMREVNRGPRYKKKGRKT